MLNKRTRLGPKWPNLHKRMKKTGENLQNLYGIAEHISWSDIL